MRKRHNWTSLNFYIYMRHFIIASISINFIKLRANALKNITIPHLEWPSNILKRTCDAIFLTTFYLCEQKITLKYFHQTVLVTKSLKVSLKVPQLQKCQIVTKVPLCMVTLVPHCYKSSLWTWQNFPFNVTKVPQVTKVPYFCYKSVLFSWQKCPFLWLSPSPSPSLSLFLPLWTSRSEPWKRGG